MSQMDYTPTPLVTEGGPFYYAAYNPETGIVQGWYYLYAKATAPNFKELTLEEYNKWSSSPGAKIDPQGNLTPYTPPVVAVPLKDQAAAALQKTRTAVYNNYGILGEPTPDEWVSYLRALMAIVNGKDTTSTTLPTPPDSTLI